MSTWFEDRQPSHNETTNYDSNYNSGQETFWNADKITSLSASTSKVEKLRLCNVLVQTSVPIGAPGYECNGGTVVSYNNELTASSHLVSRMSGGSSSSMHSMCHAWSNNPCAYFGLAAYHTDFNADESLSCSDIGKNDESLCCTDIGMNAYAALLDMCCRSASVHWCPKLRASSSPFPSPSST